MIHKGVIEKATTVSKLSDVIRAKIGAVLFAPNGRIITFAYNKTYFGHFQRYTIHAEEHLIAKAFRLKAIDRFGELYILVVRTRVCDGRLAIAKPCDKCKLLLKEAGFETIYFSNYAGQIEEMKI